MSDTDDRSDNQAIAILQSQIKEKDQQIAALISALDKQNKTEEDMLDLLSGIEQSVSSLAEHGIEVYEN